MDILILNIGGTFNKKYHLNGNLEVRKDNKIIKKIFKKSFLKNQIPKIKGLIYKDSLFMTKKDRKKILNYIKKSKYKKILIIHGTDTIDKTAKNLKKLNKQIVLTGAMVPFSINKTEAVANLFLSYGFLLNLKNNGVYIGLNGVIDEYNKIKKDKEKGYFKKI